MIKVLIHAYKHGQQLIVQIIALKQVFYRGAGKLHAHVTKLTFHSTVDSSVQEVHVFGSNRILTALVLKFAGACWGATALLTSCLTLNT